ncbi:hypothetical protein CBR_g19677 [Chara braunii]|uniref:Uncharacterized protein n=1 Tax=Chara braunii TaxID=69332 RepID=A0A388KYM8_CHABU|nr:hypothetical protein CBR_g19677 [Chara braunii]|eukprot:GBG75164.1 hypothetical protein CBR_g19677 [Chara braunii]
MKELFRKIVRKEEEVEERTRRHAEEVKKRKKVERRESEKLREEQAREAKLEATIVRILSQRKELRMITASTQPAAENKKRSPTSKARMLREIQSYIAESDDDSEEVKLEANKLIEALENRKRGKRTTTVFRAATSQVEKKKTPVIRKGKEKEKAAEAEVAECFKTPMKTCPAEGSSEGLVDYTLTQAKQLSSLKAPEIRKLCDREGVEYIVEDQAVQELVRCRTRLAYEGFFERKVQVTPTTKRASEDLDTA